MPAPTMDPMPSDETLHMLIRPCPCLDGSIVSVMDRLSPSNTLRARQNSTVSRSEKTAAICCVGASAGWK